MNIIKRIKSNKLLYFLSILIIGLIIVLVVRIAYAYLASFIQEGIGNATVISDKVDEFKIIDGEPLVLHATPTTLPENGTNLVSTTKPKVSLKANSTKNTATYNYYVYLNITNNTFTYSTTSGSPEIILTVINPAGEEVTNIEGLTYGTYNGVTGYDVTTYSGLITIAKEYEIVSNSSDEATIDEWNISLTYLNLNEDQSSNYGNSLSVDVSVQKEAKVILADYIKGLYTTDGTNALYLHDADLANGAGDNSYRYAGSSEEVNNYVCFGSDAETCPYDNLYRIIGVFGDNVKLIKHDAINSEQLGLSVAYEHSLDSFDKYKGSLTTIPTFYWNGTSSDKVNDWTVSKLNIDALNGTYLINIGTLWNTKIVNTKWIVGGNTSANLTNINAQSAYQAEIINPAESSTYNNKTGLIYMHEYYFASSPTYWTYPGTDVNVSFDENYDWVGEDYSKAINNNWLFVGVGEWTITRSSDSTSGVFCINAWGAINECSEAIVRPTFNLSNFVSYIGGNGTFAEPYRIQ